jgi:CheY-like chemotaxis protein
MLGPRILVVDDVPDWRDTLAGLLFDAGYTVYTAADSDQALTLLGQKHPHIAVLDVRLKESDAANREGILLMRRIKQCDPTVAIIVLTGYADVQMVQDARQPDSSGEASAFAFVEKPDTDQLLVLVQRALACHVRINFALRLEDPENVLSGIADKLRFFVGEKPAPQSLVKELDELLRKLFSPCESIEVRQMGGRFSGSAVLRVSPVYKDRGRGEPLVAKVGEYEVIEREATAFRKLAQGIVGSHRLPQQLDASRTRHVGGIKYSFAGLGEVIQFDDFYTGADVKQIERVLRNLYHETCFPHSRVNQQQSRECDLSRFFLEHLRMTPTRLREALGETTGRRHICSVDSTASDLCLCLPNGAPLANPVSFVESVSLVRRLLVCTIHGDLTGYNVLVDRHLETWLVDFGNLCVGPAVQDFASFECYVKSALLRVDDWQTIYEYEKASLRSAKLLSNPKLINPSGLPELTKANGTIRLVRWLAYDILGEECIDEYMIALLFNSLKMITIRSLPRARRDHALISAALVCERLSHNQSSAS